jgi:serine/threonine protein kinase
MEGDTNAYFQNEADYSKMITQQQSTSGSVTKKDFEMISVIGKGSYGKVMLVKKKDNG